MKRFILLVMLMLLMCGCVNIKTSSYTEIIDAGINSKQNIYNTYRTGYKFYLPAGLYVADSKEYNEIIKSDKETFYLYLDLVSYLNKKENTYTVNKNSYYSSLINSGEKSGYIEINQQNDKYLVEIVYNYAKIEVMVGENRLKTAVAHSIIVLSSIYYNDNILNSLSADTVLNYSEENVDIFKSHGSENSNFLDIVEEFDTYQEPTIPDYDVIN